MKILKLGFILLFVAALAGASLSLVFLNTADRIADVKAEKIFKLQKQILPQAESFEDADNGVLKIGYDASGIEIGKIVSVAPKGYSGNIEMLVGIDNTNRTTSIKIVKQSETPGLGANIIKPGFLNQFSSKLAEELLLDKDSSNGTVESITGATISSRAVMKGVKESLNKYMKKNDEEEEI